MWVWAVTTRADVLDWEDIPQQPKRELELDFEAYWRGWRRWIRQWQRSRKRQCGTCHQNLPASFFSEHTSGRRVSLLTRCKACVAAVRRRERGSVRPKVRVQPRRVA